MILCNAWEYLSTCWKWGGRGANQRGHRSLSLENITHKWHSCFSIFFKTKCLNTDPSSPKMFPCFHLWNTLYMEVQFSAQRREELNCRFVSWFLQKEQKKGAILLQTECSPILVLIWTGKRRLREGLVIGYLTPLPSLNLFAVVEWTDLQRVSLNTCPSWSVQTF